MPEMDEIKNEEQSPEIDDFASMVNYALAQRYRNVLKIIQGYPTLSGIAKGACDKETLTEWLLNPRINEQRIREVSRLFFRMNGQYRRLCNYQPNMVKFSYIISPASKVKARDEEAYKDAYMNVAYQLDVMNISTEFRKVLATVMRDGIAFGYCKSSRDTFCIVMLDADYCRTASVDGFGRIRFEFNFDYFAHLVDDVRAALLDSLGVEFKSLYEKYLKTPSNNWQMIGDNGICIKYQEDILEYSLPPYISVIDPLLEIEDYRKLAKAREETGNYNLLNFEIPTTDDGKILMDSKIVRKFIDNITSEVPANIGLIYSPLKTEKFSFAKDSNVANRSAITDAESQFWAASGVSELLFGSAKSSANALNKSIIADEIDIYPVMKQIERWINFRLRNIRNTYKFKIKFLDVTSFNESDVYDMYSKAGNSGVPVKTAMGAALGFTPFEIMGMSELENDVLHMRDDIYNEPLMSTNTMASETDTEGGRPEVDADDLSESGEKTRENEGNVRE